MARKVYVGVNTQVPVYKTSTITIDSEAKLLQYFTREDEGDYTFEHVSNGKFQSNNARVYEEDEWYDEENDEWVTDEYSPTAYVNFQAISTIENLYFDWSVSSEEDYDFLNISYINYNSSGGGGWIVLVSDASGTQSGTCGPITLYAGDRISLGYSKDSSTDSGNDCGTISNIHWSTSVQTGTTNKSLAHNVNNIYIGVNNIAKQIVKGYVGIGGVARPFFDYNTIGYYGAITPLSQKRQSLAATSNKSYALFGGGYYHLSKDAWPNVEAYDSTLVQTRAADLQLRRYNLTAGSIGDYALFIGGYQNDIESDLLEGRLVDAYDSNLTHSIAPDLQFWYQDYGGTANIGDYVLVINGYWDKGIYVGYTPTLSQTSVFSFSPVRTHCGLTSTPNCIIVAGGTTWSGTSSSGVSAAVNIINADLTNSQITNLSTARSETAGAIAGNYSIFLGSQGSSASQIIDVYHNDTLTRSTLTSLTHYWMHPMAVSLRGKALYVNGNNVTYSTKVTYQFDEDLTKTTLTSMQYGNTEGAATVLKNKYAFLAGDIFIVIALINHKIMQMFMLQAYNNLPLSFCKREGIFLFY